MFKNVTWGQMALYALAYVVGFYSIPAAFSAGMTIGVGTNGYIFGLIFVGVVIVSWQFGPLAIRCWREKLWWQGSVLFMGWLVAFAMVLVTSIGYTATNRAATVGSRVAAISRFTDAKSESDKVTRELDQLKRDPLWAKTGQCARSSFDYTNYTAFCSRERDLQKRADAARAKANTLDADRPVVGDAQAESLAAALPWLDAATVAKELPVWTAVALEALPPTLLFAAELPIFGRPRSTAKKRTRKSKALHRAGQLPTVKRLVQSPTHPNVYFEEPSGDIKDFRQEKALRALTGRARKLLR